MQRIEVEEGPAHAAVEPSAGVRGARDCHPPVQPQPYCVAQAMQCWMAMLLFDCDRCYHSNTVVSHVRQERAKQTCQHIQRA